MTRRRLISSISPTQNLKGTISTRSRQLALPSRFGFATKPCHPAPLPLSRSAQRQSMSRSYTSTESTGRKTSQLSTSMAYCKKDTLQMCRTSLVVGSGTIGPMVTMVSRLSSFIQDWISDSYRLVRWSTIQRQYFQNPEHHHVLQHYR